MILFVTATRKSRADFDKGPLGQSMRRIDFDKQIILSVTTENSLGLPAVYNQVITEQYREHQAVFLHDDIFSSYRIQDGLEHFDVIGLAGNRE